MANPVFREFYSERDVITEERRMSENSPGSFFQEQLNATFYAAVRTGTRWWAGCRTSAG